jgi:hypothetical protein
MDLATAPTGIPGAPGAAGAAGVGGPVAAAVAAAAGGLGRARPGSVDADAAIEVVLAARWAQAAAVAVQVDALTRLEAAYPEGGLRGRDPEHAAVVYELMAALGCSQRSAANRLAFAAGLGGLPALGEAARAGEVDLPLLHLVLDRVDVLDPADRVVAVDRLLAAQRVLPGGLTRAQAGRLLGRIVAGLDPAGAQRRQAGSRRDRRVWHDPADPAGAESTLGMTGPAQRVAICFQVVDALARAICADPHSRPGPTLEQARFDALEWLITGRPATTHPAWPPPDHDTDRSEHTGDTDPDTDPDAEPADTVTADEVPPWELPDHGRTRDTHHTDTDPADDVDGAGDTDPDVAVDGADRPADNVGGTGGDLRPGEGRGARNGDAGPEPPTDGRTDVPDPAGDPGSFAAAPAPAAGVPGAGAGCRVWVWAAAGERGRDRAGHGVPAHPARAGRRAR